LFVDGPISDFGFGGKWDAAKVEAVCKASINAGLADARIDDPTSNTPTETTIRTGYAVDAEAFGLGTLCISFVGKTCFPVSIHTTTVAPGKICQADQIPGFGQSVPKQTVQTIAGQSGQTAQVTTSNQAVGAQGTASTSGTACLGPSARSIIDIILRRKVKTVGASCSIVSLSSQTSLSGVDDNNLIACCIFKEHDQVDEGDS
jgi:hypothetical protein